MNGTSEGALRQSEPGPNPNESLNKALASHCQHTLATTAACEGVGLHSGAPARMEIHPAAENTGIVFVRTDVAPEKARIPARWDRIADTRLCSMLKNEHGTTLGTVEHVMAALAGCHIDNAEIRVHGPELPIMDGSSEDFVKLIEKAGTKVQTAPRRFIRVLRRITVGAGDRSASLAPAPESSFSFEIDFAAKAIGRQTRTFTLVNGDFAHELANARTFTNKEEVEKLQKLGLGKGGSLENAIVVDGEKILNEDGLRHDDEFVRHKLLDSVGDLYLAGAPILGAYHSHKGGHELNNQLLVALFADSRNWTWG